MRFACALHVRHQNLVFLFLQGSACTLSLFVKGASTLSVFFFTERSFVYHDRVRNKRHGRRSKTTKSTPPRLCYFKLLPLNIHHFTYTFSYAHTEAHTHKHTCIISTQEERRQPDKGAWLNGPGVARKTFQRNKVLAHTQTRKKKDLSSKKKKNVRKNYSKERKKDIHESKEKDLST